MPRRTIKRGYKTFQWIKPRWIPMSDEIPRDPSFYRPSIHSGQQNRHRGFDWDIIAEVIQEGEVLNDKDDNKCMFSKKYWFSDEPIGVLVNYKTGDIITVEWRKYTDA